MKAKIPSRFLSSRRSPPWSTSLKRCFEPNHWYRFRQLRNAALAALRQAKKEFYNRLALSLSHPKTFWGLYHSITSLKQRVPPVLHQGNEETTDTIAKAELLKQFMSTFIGHANHQTPYLLPTPPAGVPCSSSVHCDSSEYCCCLF